MSLSSNQLASLRSRDAKALRPVLRTPPLELPPLEPFPDLDGPISPESSGQSRYRTPGQPLNKVIYEKFHAHEARGESDKQENMPPDRRRVFEKRISTNKHGVDPYGSTGRFYRELWVSALDERKMALEAAKETSRQKLDDATLYQNRIRSLETQVTAYKETEESLTSELTDLKNEKEALTEEISNRKGKYRRLVEKYEKLKKDHNSITSKYNASLQTIENFTADLEETQFRSALMEKELLPGQVASIDNFVATGLSADEYRRAAKPKVAAIVGSRSRLYTVQHHLRAGTDTLNMSGPRAAIPSLSDTRAWPALGRN